MTILVTGYQAPKGKPNVSETLVRSLMDEPSAVLKALGERVQFELLDVDRSDTDSKHQSQSEALARLLYEHRPQVCLFLGEAPGRGKITLERLAINYLVERRIVDEAPAAYWSDLPVFDAIPQMLQDLGVAASHSNFAGSHLCNHLLFSALHLSCMTGLPVRSGLLHLPLLPEQCQGELAYAPSMELPMLRVAVSAVIQAVAASVPGGEAF